LFPSGSRSFFPWHQFQPWLKAAEVEAEEVGAAEARLAELRRAGHLVEERQVGRRGGRQARPVHLTQARLELELKGVSGIPNGPANVGGLNNSGNDPSGFGNSAKAPDIPTNNTVGTANPSGRSSTPNSSSMGDSRQSIRAIIRLQASLAPVTFHRGRQPKANGTRMPGNGTRTRTDAKNSDAQIDAENQKLDAKIKSICKGC
jgi:hypothetical protein